MVTNSGIVLDEFYNHGIGSVAIYVLSPTSTGIIDLQYSEPNGYFEINMPGTGSGVIYAPSLSGYVGESLLTTTGVSPILLFMRPTTALPNQSGVGSIVLKNRSHTTSTNIRDVQHTPTELYSITEAGMDILDLTSLLNVGYVNYTPGFTCFNVLKNYPVRSGVLLGTPSSGVLEFGIPTSGYSTSSRDLTYLLKTKYTVQSQSITANTIQCIDRTEAGGTIFGTPSGVDHYTPSGNHYKTTFSSGMGVTACAISDYGDLYYSPTNSGLYVKYGPVTNHWTSPDYIVSLSGTGINPFPLLTGKINDIKITSISGANTVILATASGLLIYDENRADLNISASGCKLLRSYP